MRAVIPQKRARWNSKGGGVSILGGIRADEIVGQQLCDVAPTDLGLRRVLLFGHLTPSHTPARQAPLCERDKAAGDAHGGAGRADQAFMFAIETAMRAGEIARLAWSGIDLDKRVARLGRAKNGDARNVPISREAVRILKQIESRDPPVGFTSGENLSAN
ncbi:MAG TPA: tyrosine-type recombinase/integrase [Paenirhodobacter sp.]